MQTYRIDQNSIDMAEHANRLRIMANAAGGYHAQQHGGTYGPASEALTLALACGIAEQNSLYFEEARVVAKQIHEECIDNGEDVTYQITHVFRPGDPYDRGLVIEVIPTPTGYGCAS